MIMHDFKVQTNWENGRSSIGDFKADHIDGKISIPSELGGPGDASNPDELLVAAASSCYIISLAAALERARFTNVKITLNSVGTASLSKSGKFKMETITHYPTVSTDDTEKLEKRIEKLIEIADNNCMVSNAIRGNVEIIVKPTIDSK